MKQQITAYVMFIILLQLNTLLCNVYTPVANERTLNIPKSIAVSMNLLYTVTV